MNRRNFIKAAQVAGVVGAIAPSMAFGMSADPTAVPVVDGATDRKYWVDTLTKIAGPVLINLSKGNLKKVMPLEVAKGYDLQVEKATYMEALGRTIAGVAPWLTLPPDNTPEGKLRKEYNEYALKAIAHAVDPNSPDYMNFSDKKIYQPLVDSAYLAHAFIRAPKQLWDPLDLQTKKNVIKAFDELKWIKPNFSNWLLFAAMVEAGRLFVNEDWDPMRVDYAVKKHQEWYKGDGWYGDGNEFHFDYYNGYVIQPMLVDILKVLADKKQGNIKNYEQALKRMQRFAVIQERLISPEGTYPPVGRSITYRVGAFQPLAQLAWQDQLPEELSPAQVRCALTAVMKNIFEAKGTFSKDGWLQLGFCGHQPEVADSYTSTGSLYITSLAFLPLGLPATHKFWTDPAAEWTGKKAWSGKTLLRDHATNV